MSDLTEPLDALVDRVRARQIAAWDSGHRAPLESFLDELPEEKAGIDTLLDLIYAEVLLREEHGERPTLEEYQKRFPDLEAPLRRQFALHEGLASLDTHSEDTQIDLPRLSAPRIRDDLPTQIGPYRILEEIGRGGMGIVYRGKHQTLTFREAAIKVLRPGEVSEEYRARFVTEARAVAALSHPSIVQIHEIEVSPNGEQPPFVALEYVAGQTLSQRINGTPLPPREAAELLLPLAEAMAHAHERGIVHRDLKPANVLLASGTSERRGDLEPGRSHAPLALPIPKITDFGLAKELDADTAQTRTGAVMGTPSYMAPEQARGEEARPAADIYALGAVLYEMLTGRPPFKGNTVLNTLQQVTTLDPVAPTSLTPDVPADLETICLKCLQKEPHRRYLTAQALADDVGRYLRGEPIHARRVGLIERAIKWVKRRPTTATLLGGGVAVLAGLVALWIAFTFRLNEERRVAVEQRDEAKRQKGIAEEESEKARKQSERATHLLSLTSAAVDDIAIQVRTAKADELETRNTGSVLFKLACYYAKVCSTLNADTSLLPEDRKRLAEQYATSAVRLLVCAKEVKFFTSDRPMNRAELKTNPELAVLRERRDFRELMSRLGL